MQIYPIHIATEGLLDAEIGIATRGWIIEIFVPPTPPITAFIVPVGWVGEYDTIIGWTGEWEPDP